MNPVIKYLVFRVVTCTHNLAYNYTSLNLDILMQRMMLNKTGLKPVSKPVEQEMVFYCILDPPPLVKKGI